MLMSDCLDWRQEENGRTEDEIVGWHHRLKGHEFGQTLGDSEGQRSLACCSPWGPKESDTTKPLNSLSTIRLVSSAYLRLLTFPLAILIPACAKAELLTVY